jgi:monomeric isocitrate dehydrogenase
LNKLHLTRFDYKNKKTQIKNFYTLTDEAPLLATYSFYLLYKHLQELLTLKLKLETFLYGRILSNFQNFDRRAKTGDSLLELGQLATTPEANIIKLPNVSASVPQLKQPLLSCNHMVTYQTFQKNLKTMRKNDTSQIF